MRSKLSIHRRAFALAIVAALGSTTGLLAQDPPGSPPQSKADPLVDRVLEGHNRERSKEGLAPLKPAAKLQEAAKIQANDMAEHHFMAHEGSDKSTPVQRIARVAYRYLHTGENVATGYRDPDEVVQVWMDSPPHKKNILGDFSEIGVAVSYDEDGKPYWCVEFGKPMPSFDPTSAAADLVKKINEERVAAKLPPLSIDPKLAKPAQDKAAELAKKNSQGGSTANFDGVDQDLYKDLALSTAGGQPDAAAMIKALTVDKKLKAQILGKFSKVGIGYATSADGIPYWCVILANPAREDRPKAPRRRQ